MLNVVCAVKTPTADSAQLVMLRVRLEALTVKIHDEERRHCKLPVLE